MYVSEVRGTLALASRFEEVFKILIQCRKGRCRPRKNFLRYETSDE